MTTMLHFVQSPFEPGDGSSKKVVVEVRPSRDTAIDALRAICLIMIFVNHVPGNPFEPVTSKNWGFSDAAEAFVLISGVSAAYAYGLKFLPGRMIATALGAWRRAGVLYVSHLAGTLATLGIFAFFALHYQAPELLEKINIGPVVAAPAEAMIGLVTLGHQLGYNNILSMYAGVLVMLPVFLWLGRRSITLMLAASGVLWLVAGLAFIAPPNYPGEGYWFLNPLSWQFLFIVGLAARMHVARYGAFPVIPLLQYACAAYLLVSLLWVRIPLWGVDISMGMPTLFTGFDKTFLSAPRLLHILALGYLIATLPRIAGSLRLSSRHPLVMLGRHSLPIFMAGTLLAMVAQAWRYVHGAGGVSDIAIIMGGIALQFALAFYLDWYGRMKKGTMENRQALPGRVSGTELDKAATERRSMKARVLDAV